MAYIHPGFEAFQRRRFMRPDAVRWLREDAERYLPPTAPRRSVERKYDPSQPRVPAGNSDGGQWTATSEGQNGGDFLKQKRSELLRATASGQQPKRGPLRFLPLPRLRNADSGSLEIRPPENCLRGLS